MSNLEMAGPLLVQRLAVSQQEVQIHRQPCKVVLIQLGRVVGAQLVRGGLRWSAMIKMANQVLTFPEIAATS